MMASIKGKDTAPEQLVRRYLHSAGLRFRLHDRRLPGTPDLVLPKYFAAVFVHGCFWHRHLDCKFTTNPTTRAEFWAAKFESNVIRDRRKAANLNEAGWRVFTIWECEAADELALDRLFWEIVVGPGSLDSHPLA